MHHPRLFKPESIANVQIEIQIVDTHETLETRTVIGLQAFDRQINRTLLKINNLLCKTESRQIAHKQMVDREMS